MQVTVEMCDECGNTEKKTMELETILSLLFRTIALQEGMIHLVAKACLGDDYKDKVINTIEEL